MSKAVQEWGERLQIGLSLAAHEVLEALAQKERGGASFLSARGLRALPMLLSGGSSPAGPFMTSFMRAGRRNLRARSSSSGALSWRCAEVSSSSKS
jgi:hypothetical protein